MQRPLLLTIGLGLMCCQARTELVVGIATDLHLHDDIDTVELDVARVNDPAPFVMQPFDLSGMDGEPYNLPASYALFSDSGEAQVDITVIGQKAGSPVVTRHAILSLVDGQTLFYRLGLTRVCESMMGCGSDEDCVEGTCQPTELDSSRFPAFATDLVDTLACKTTTSPIYIDTVAGAPMMVSDSATPCPDGLCSEGTCLAAPTGGALCGTATCTAQQQCVNDVCVGTGSLRFTLHWTVPTDVDLHVLTPKGNEISYLNRTADSGTLDVDDTGSGPLVENVFFTAPPPGMYTYWANNFDGTVATGYTLTVATPAGTVATNTDQLPAQMVDGQHFIFQLAGLR